LLLLLLPLLLLLLLLRPGHSPTTETNQTALVPTPPTAAQVLMTASASASSSSSSFRPRLRLGVGPLRKLTRTPAKSVSKRRCCVRSRPAIPGCGEWMHRPSLLARLPSALQLRQSKVQGIAPRLSHAPQPTVSGSVWVGLQDRVRHGCRTTSLHGRTCGGSSRPTHTGPHTGTSLRTLWLWLWLWLRFGVESAFHLERQLPAISPRQISTASQIQPTPPPPG